MKQHLTEINGRPLLFLELPKGATPISISDKEITCSYECGLNLHKKQLPDGNWQLYGSPFSLSEEQAKELVDGYSGAYDDYTHTSVGLVTLNTALESWQSFLESEKVFDKNPYGNDKPIVKTDDFFLEYANIRKLEKWQEAEHRVFRNAVLLAEVKK